MNATLGTRLLAFLDRLTVLLSYPHRPHYLSGGYDSASRIIPGHALIQVLRNQRVAPRSRRLPA